MDVSNISKERFLEAKKRITKGIRIMLNKMRKIIVIDLFCFIF